MARATLVNSTARVAKPAKTYSFDRPTVTDFDRVCHFLWHHHSGIQNPVSTARPTRSLADAAADSGDVVGDYLESVGDHDFSQADTDQIQQDRDRSRRFGETRTIRLDHLGSLNCPSRKQNPIENQLHRETKTQERHGRCPTRH